MSYYAAYRGTEREQVAPTSEKNQAAGSSSTTTVKVFPAITRERRSEEEREESYSALKAYQLETLKKMHLECLGRPMPAPIAAAVLRDLRSETPSAYYRYALMEVCYAPRPSWRYVQAIVNRCKAQGIDPTELEI